jgi:hypothetical protein
MQLRIKIAEIGLSQTLRGIHPPKTAAALNPWLWRGKTGYLGGWFFQES